MAIGCVLAAQLMMEIGTHFFINRPRYSTNERPLMDSRDYADVLSNFIIFPAPWQRVDRDSNNSVGVLTEVYI